MSPRKVCSKSIPNALLSIIVARLEPKVGTILDTVVVTLAISVEGITKRSTSDPRDI